MRRIAFRPAFCNASTIAPAGSVPITADWNELMRLVYISPLPYDSFSQRPHQFVDWFHRRTGGEVLWVDPYPTRLPRLSDLRRPFDVEELGGGACGWLKVRRVRSMPIEPIAGVSRINELFWEGALEEIARFSEAEPTIVAIGKPSALANLVLRRFPLLKSVYDMMDNFPAFYGGVSKRVFERRERQVVEAVGMVVCSSTNLLGRALALGADPHLVKNAHGPDPSFIAPRLTSLPSERPLVLGYVGTIARWFDWKLVAELASARPRDIVRLIGPLYDKPTFELPLNVEILPPVSHPVAIEAMRNFDLALIPFKENDLTWGVDPLKYYEYRALALPIVTTKFGEMARRLDESGVFFVDDATNIKQVIEKATKYVMTEDERRSFIELNSWNRRFDGSPFRDILHN